MFIDTENFTEEKIFEALDGILRKIKAEVYDGNFHFNKAKFDVKFNILEKYFLDVKSTQSKKVLTSLILNMQAIIIPNQDYKKEKVERYKTALDSQYDNIIKPFVLKLSDNKVYFVDGEKEISITKLNQSYQSQMFEIFGEKYKQYLVSQNIQMENQAQQEMVL